MNDDEDAAKAFRTYANYVDAFARLADGRNTSEDQAPIQRLGRTPSEPAVSRAIIDELHNAPELARAKPTTADWSRNDLAKSLSNAWATEVVLATVHQSLPEEALILSAQWAVTQAYYASYQVTRAFAIASTGNVLTSHATIQRSFENVWCQRRLKVSPLSLSYGHAGAVNRTAARRTDPHNLSSVTYWNCEDFAEMALRTTYDRALDEQLKRARAKKAQDRRRGWDQEEKERVDRGLRTRKRPQFSARANLTPSETQSEILKSKSMTLIDFLYRLRIGAQYDDATVYSFGISNDTDASQLFSNFRVIVVAIMSASEVMIHSMIGNDAFADIAKQWCSAQRRPPESGTFFNRVDLITD